MYISGEKNLDTTWKELTEEFEEELQRLNVTVDFIWNTTRERETKHPFTQSELKLITTDQSRESVAQKRFWRLRPDVLAFRLQTKTKTGTLCILEFKCMSDVTDQHLTRVRSRTEDQYVSLRRDLGMTLQHQGWKVEQISFIPGSRSLNEQDLRKNLKFFRVPEANIEAIGSKLSMKIFDEYANILRCMYSTRFNGDPSRTGSSHEDNPTPENPPPFLIRSLESGRPDKFRRRTMGTKERKDS
jgi:hypothetical protein